MTSLRATERKLPSLRATDHKESWLIAVVFGCTKRRAAMKASLFSVYQLL